MDVGFLVAAILLLFFLYQVFWAKKKKASENDETWDTETLQETKGKVVLSIFGIPIKRRIERK